MLFSVRMGLVTEIRHIVCSMLRLLVGVVIVICLVGVVALVLLWCVAGFVLLVVWQLLFLLVLVAFATWLLIGSAHGQLPSRVSFVCTQYGSRPMLV